MSATKQKKIKIVADSSADIISLEGMDFSAAPLKIITAEREYVDDKSLDVEQMANDLISYKGRSSTSCPNVNDWLFAFGDADEIFCVTITATLSGSYNSAMLAKREYEESHPDRRVFVLNSLSTGPEIVLIAEKIRELVLAGRKFDEICGEVEEYSREAGLIFVLESLKNLANNGRVNAIVAKMAGLLGVRLVGKASDKGDLEPLNKCRGERKALETVVEHLVALGLKNGKVKIGHCLNQKTAEALKELIIQKCPQSKAEIYKLGGLCSFYAEKGGIIIGFEKK